MDEGAAYSNCNTTRRYDETGMLSSGFSAPLSALMAIQELAIKVHDERESSANKGNYKELAAVLAR
jgi:hypothetical protein